MSASRTRALATTLGGLVNGAAPQAAELDGMRHVPVVYPCAWVKSARRV